MKTLLAGVTVLGLAATSAVAGTRYDRKIEEAAAAIVAAKMGELRGGFSYDARLRFVGRSDVANTGSVAAPGRTSSASREGLAPAVAGKAPPTGS